MSIKHLTNEHTADTTACWDDLTADGTADGIADTTCTYCLRWAAARGDDALLSACDTVNSIASEYAVDRNAVLKTITASSLSDRTRAEGDDVRIVLNDDERDVFMQDFRDTVRAARR